MANGWKERIQVTSLTADGGSYVVEIGCFTGQSSQPIVQFRDTISRQDFDEADVVRVARSRFHNMCKHLMEATAEWNLTEDDYSHIQK